MQQLKKTAKIKYDLHNYLLASQSTACFCNANLSPQNLGV